MHTKDQIREVFIHAPQTIRLHTKKSALVMLIYLIAAFTVFGLFAAILLANEAQLKKALFDYLLPSSWHKVSGYAMKFFFESQTKIVLASMIISGSLVLASLLLFPLKEYCSSTFEDANYHRRRKLEFPLWLQALEEVKLFVLYLTAQSVILAIGFYPFLWAKIISSILSLLFLFFSFGLDFISPTLQRSRIKYSHILKLLSRNWLCTMLFGLIYSLPVLFLAKYVLSIESLTLAQMSAIVICCNLIFLALAIPAGTRVAHSILPEAKTVSAPSLKSKQWIGGVSFIVLVLALSFHYRLGLSIHHKSQILKCEYDIHWRTMDVDFSTLKSLTQKDGRKGTIKFDLEIKNPTEYVLKIDDSVLTIKQYDKVVSKTNIKALSIAPGESVNQTMVLDSTFNAKAISKFTKLLGGWDIYLEYDVLPGIPFIAKLK